MKYLISLVLVTVLIPLTSPAQKSADVYVDKAGVMRWGKTKEEVQGFGVNYTAMFAHAYRTAKRLNIPIEKAIDDDVYHFTRLGFDLFRVHVWDTQISDTVGNLLKNENLRLFDYTVAKMKERGFRFIITPIAFWGNGWPEPDDKTPGFSAKYGKDACLTNSDAILAQQRYLAQFLDHVNQYTGLAYKADPSVIGFEISNEPHHQESAEKVTAFIKGMVKSMRGTGCKKPIFYNVSHSIHLADAYAAAGIQGGTFQWYPTGLGSRHELGGNILPNVDRYVIPFANNASYKSMAKIVYEFDAADVGRSYIYPAMARSFREAGIQVATHFAYDPTFMADVNTEYGTHYMNLAYAPQKALSLKIASEVFHQVPMNKSYGGYPANTTFENFRVRYEDDLAEMVTEKAFYYTNHTKTSPPTAEKLEHIAGSGDSPLVRYEGTGAYFLDRLEPGVWRLEVMPDAIWIEDPFTPTSPKKQVGAIRWNAWPMTVTVPDLGPDFQVTKMNGGNASASGSSNGNFVVTPGTYVLTKKGITNRWKATDTYERIKIGEFTAPESNVRKTYVLHQPLREVVDGAEVDIEATVVGPDMPLMVEVHVLTQGRRSEIITMKRERNYTYRATIGPGVGFLRYYIVVKDGKGTRTFPADTEGGPRDWDFYDRRTYEVPVVPKNVPLYLFDATTDANEVSRPWIWNSGVFPTEVPGKLELRIPVEKLFIPDPENRNGEKIADYSMRYFFGKNIAGRRDELTGKTKIILNGRSLVNRPTTLQVALILRDGSTYGALVTLEAVQKDYSLSVADLKSVKLVTLPRPYPTFLPYYFTPSQTAAFDLTKVESLQISLGPGLSPESQQQAQGFVIRTVRVEY